MMYFGRDSSDAVSLERNVPNVSNDEMAGLQGYMDEKNSTIRVFVVIDFNSSFGKGNYLHGDGLYAAECASGG
jgi:hypothetical protein